MLVIRREALQIQSETDIVKVRQVVRNWSVEFRFGLVDQTKLITAASEIARNTLRYGKGGTLQMEALREELKIGLRLVFEDHGPGISDINLAMTDGYTSGGGLGMGLPGAKRLTNEFEISSKPGEGTRVAITKWKGY